MSEQFSGKGSGKGSGKSLIRSLFWQYHHKAHIELCRYGHSQAVVLRNYERITLYLYPCV